MAADQARNRGIPLAQDRSEQWYARYVLVVLLIVYVFNFIDRQILAVLAEDIKADLGVSDAQLGFLFGTAFAVFYATFGIAFGRLADVWDRRKLISLGLSFWSLMTALSGLARSFLPLAACRFGVGVGEASASPAAFSMLYDYFSPKVRTTVMAIYSSGVYIGAGMGLFLGGAILDAWSAAWPTGGAPFGLKGWQVAFMVVGLPGILMALWVFTLREPKRGQNDGILSETHPHPFRETWSVLLSMLPVVNWQVIARGKTKQKSIGINILALATIALATWILTRLTGDVLQWAALGAGVYAVVSWAQVLVVRDPVVFSMIFKCRSLRNVVLAGGTTTFMGVALGFWSVPFVQRYHHVSASEAGMVMGVAFALMGFLGIIFGGLLADRLFVWTRKGKLYVWLGGVIASLLCALLFLTADDSTLAYTGAFLMYLTASMAHGPGVSTVNDLVLPRGRATASAFGLMVATLVGTALGPYLTGHISDAIVATGVDDGEALRQAMLWSLLLPVGGVLLIVDTLPHIEADKTNLLARARALGEKV